MRLTISGSTIPLVGALLATQACTPSPGPEKPIATCGPSLVERTHVSNVQWNGIGSQFMEVSVEEDVFNLELRKFLKGFGVTAQREIEKAVETALRERQLVGDEILPVHATLSIPGVLSTFEIKGEIALASPT